MSLFSSLFGSGTRQLNQAAAIADQRLLEGRDAALAALQSGRGDINAAADSALAAYNSAEPGLMDLIRSGYAGANSAINTGYGNAESAVKGAETRANSALQPFYASGLGAQGLYDQATGVRGAQAQQDFYGNYASNDPFRRFRDEQAQRELERRYNAGGAFVGGGAGGGGSGRFATASARASLERGTADLNSYLDRLERAGTRGQQVAGQMSQNSMSTGSQLGQINATRGDRLSSNAAAEGSALSGLGATFAGNRAAVEANRGAALSGQQGNIANLQFGYGQQNAANEINLGNALNAARNQPMQNLLGLGGLAIQAYTGFNPNSLRGTSANRRQGVV